MCNEKVYVGVLYTELFMLSPLFPYFFRSAIYILINFYYMFMCSFSSSLCALLVVMLKVKFTIYHREGEVCPHRLLGHALGVWTLISGIDQMQ